jgi:uncharacterized membrane protein YkoI
MNRTRKIIIATGAAAAVVVGGATIAVAQQDPGPPDLDRAAQIGLDTVGGGDVMGVEQNDDGSYEVEVRRTDGSEIDVDLSATFDVVRTDDDLADSDDADADERPVDTDTRTRAGDAALAAVGDGDVVSVETDDGGGYDVEIRHADGTESEVTLDAALNVLHTESDDD